jgi:hypothetical protein
LGATARLENFLFGGHLLPMTVEMLAFSLPQRHSGQHIEHSHIRFIRLIYINNIASSGLRHQDFRSQPQKIRVKSTDSTIESSGRNA